MASERAVSGQVGMATTHPHRNWIQWLKHSDHAVAVCVRGVHRFCKGWAVPCIPVLHGVLYRLHLGAAGFWQSLIQATYYNPLFKSRLKGRPQRLYLYSGMPQVGGPLELFIGEDCRISGISSFFGRSASPSTPQCVIGRNVDIGWQNTLAVGTRIEIGDNVRLAARVYLAGFPGHPIDPEARARGEAETEQQVGDIILEDNVWLATGVMVMAGVRIGRNSIVAAGSVVTHDLPSNVLAGGVPARVIKSLPGTHQAEGEK